jgi:hypothetical protein
VGCHGEIIILADDITIKTSYDRPTDFQELFCIFFILFCHTFFSYSVYVFVLVCVRSIIRSNGVCKSIVAVSSVSASHHQRGATRRQIKGSKTNASRQEGLF